MTRQPARWLWWRHTYVPGWQFPGGGVEKGETGAEQALAREIEEGEGNVTLEGSATLLSLHHNRQASARDHVAVYLLRSFQGARPETGGPDREIAGSRLFFPLDALPEETHPPPRGAGSPKLFDEQAPAAEW